MPEVIYAASNADDYEAFALLVGAYVDWCRWRYAELEWFVEEAFGHQGLEVELAALPTSYGPPSGKTLLVRSDHQVCGGGAYRKLPDGSCEMRRLFVGDTKLRRFAAPVPFIPVLLGLLYFAFLPFYEITIIPVDAPTDLGFALEVHMATTLTASRLIYPELPIPITAEALRKLFTPTYEEQR